MTSKSLVCAAAAGFALSAVLGLSAASSAVAQVEARPDHPTAPPPTPGPTPSPSPTPESPVCQLVNPNPNIEPDKAREVCIQVSNETVAFVKPGQLGLGPGYNQVFSNLTGCDVGPSSALPTLLGPGDLINGQYRSCLQSDGGDPWPHYFWGPMSITTGYAPTALLPTTDIVSFTASDQQDQNNAGSCTSSQYTLCSVDYVQAGGRAPHLNFSFRNFPVTVMIKNNLPAGGNRLTQVPGSLSYGQLLQDPAGGSLAQTIEDGGGSTTAGMYGFVLGAASTQSPNPGGQVQTFAVSYQPDAASQYPGSQIQINGAINVATGLLDQQQGTCTVTGGQQPDSVPDCDLYLLGTAGAPQTLFVNIHP